MAAGAGTRGRMEETECSSHDVNVCLGGRLWRLHDFEFQGWWLGVFVFVPLKLVERLYCWFIFFSETCDYLLISFHCGRRDVGITAVDE